MNINKGRPLTVTPGSAAKRASTHSTAEAGARKRWKDFILSGAWGIVRLFQQGPPFDKLMK